MPNATLTSSVGRAVSAMSVGRAVSAMSAAWVRELLAYVRELEAVSGSSAD
jgi:hypothetical protein